MFCVCIYIYASFCLCRYAAYIRACVYKYLPMYIFVSVYICMSMYLCLCMASFFVSRYVCLCPYTCMIYICVSVLQSWCVSMYIYVYVSFCLCVFSMCVLYLHICLCVRLCLCVLSVYICMSVSLCIWIYMCTHTYVSKCLYICVSNLWCVCVCVRVCGREAMLLPAQSHTVLPFCRIPISETRDPGIQFRQVINWQSRRQSAWGGLINSLFRTKNILSKILTPPQCLCGFGWEARQCSEWIQTCERSGTGGSPETPDLSRQFLSPQPVKCPVPGSVLWIPWRAGSDRVRAGCGEGSQGGRCEGLVSVSSLVPFVCCVCFPGVSDVHRDTLGVQASAYMCAHLHTSSKFILLWQPGAPHC